MRGDGLKWCWVAVDQSLVVDFRYSPGPQSVISMCEPGVKARPGKRLSVYWAWSFPLCWIQSMVFLLSLSPDRMTAP